MITLDEAIEILSRPKTMKGTPQDILEAHDMAITALRQPEIIRCRECKHYAFADNRAFGFPAKRCEWTGFEDVDDDDFCSRAERREESNESKERS